MNLNQPQIQNASEVTPPRTFTTSYEVSEVVNNLSYAQLDVKIPKFSNENSSNPLEFLNDLERFFIVKNTKEVKNMAVVQLAFENKSRLWLDLQSNFEKYEKFKDSYIKELYSVPIQVKVKNRWTNRKFYKEIDVNYRTFFINN